MNMNDQGVFCERAKKRVLTTNKLVTCDSSKG